MKRKTNEYGFVNSSEDYEVNYAKSKGTRSGYKGRKYAGGGESDKPEIHILNEGEKFEKSRYKAVFGDYDNDGLPNLDDPNPTKKGDKHSVEERRITDSIAELLNIKNNLDNTMYSAVDDIAKISPKDAVIYARTKTPYSIIQKLIGKRLLTPKDPKKGLTDLIGMTIAVDNFADLTKLRNLIEDGKMFNVYEVEDFYKNPLDGYMAVHYILLFKDANGTFPVELQLKTKRMKSVNEVSHKAYAQHNLDRDELLRVTSIVEKADKGDATAIKQYNALISDKDKLELSFFKDKAKKYKGGGSVDKEEWSEIGKDNNRMLRNQVREVAHHSDEINGVVNKKTKVEPWVVAKMERASTDLSDVTHYLDGNKFAGGGPIIPASGTLVSKDKNKKLDYQKNGSDFKFVVYDGEKHPVDGYERHKFKKQKGSEVTMNYNQFVNYIYSEGYIDDKDYQIIENGGSMYAGGGNIDDIKNIANQSERIWTRKELSNIIKIAKGVGAIDFYHFSSGGGFEHIALLLPDHTVVQFNNQDEGVNSSKKKYDDLENDFYNDEDFYNLGYYPNVALKPDFSNVAQIVKAIKDKDYVWAYNSSDEPTYSGGGYIGDKLLKELHKLQKELSTSGHYIENDNSPEAQAKKRNYEAKLKRFDEVLNLLRELDAQKESSKYAGGGVPEVPELQFKQIASMTGMRETFIKDWATKNNLSSNDIGNLMMGLGRKQITIRDFSSALLGKPNNAQEKKILAYAKSNKGYKMSDGGGTDEGIDLFEDYENIPAKVQKVLDKYANSFEDEDYSGLEKARKELEKIGYTFDFYLDGVAYDLRPIGTKGKSETMEDSDDGEMFAGGGDIDTKDFTNLPIGTRINAFIERRDKDLKGNIIEKTPTGYRIETHEYESYPVTYDEVTRVMRFPSKPEVQPRKKFLGLFDNGGNVFVDKTDGTTYIVGKNAKGQWTVFSEGERWTKRDEFESGLASEQDAVMLAKVMAGVIDEFDPETNVSIYDDEDEYNQDFMGLDTMRYGGDVVRHFNMPKRFDLGGPVDDSMTAVQRYFASLNYDLLPTAFATFVKEEILNDPELPYLSEKEPIFITIKEKVDALQNREEVALEVGELDSNVETQEAIDLLMELSEDQEGAEKQETLEAIELLKELLV